MHNNKTRSPVVVLVLFLLLLTGCGNSTNTPQHSSVETGAMPTITAAATPEATMTATPELTPGSVTPPSQPEPTTSSGTGENGQIQVLLEKTEYVPRDMITVKIVNGLSRTIYTSAYYTNCTPIQIERFSNAAWIGQGGCPERTTQTMAIAAGSTKSFELSPAPAGAQFNKARVTGTWDTGKYRATVYYQMQPDPDSTQGGTAVRSQEFTIQ